MRNVRNLLGAAVLLPAALFVNACGAGDPGTTDLSPEPALETRVRAAIPFTEIEDEIGAAGAIEARRLFTSAEQYRRYFGHDAPGVDFSREWVIFYSAGVKPTGGYQASIQGVTLSAGGRTLEIVTRLLSPGRDCFVSQALTTPHVLVKIDRIARRPWFIEFRSDDAVRECGSSSACDLVRCAAGTVCVELGGHAACIPDTTSPCAVVLCAVGTLCVPQPDGSPACKAICRVDADCRTANDYCTGCDCRALGPGEELAACRGPEVDCFSEPCLGKVAVCHESVCVVSPP